MPFQTSSALFVWVELMLRILSADPREDPTVGSTTVLGPNALEDPKEVRGFGRVCCREFIVGITILKEHLIHG